MLTGITTNMTNPDPQVQDLMDQLAKRLSTSDRKAAYEEGFRDGWAALGAELLKITQQPALPRQERRPVRRNGPPRVSAAGAKSQKVRDYLRDNPGAVHRELKRDLGEYVATRVYKLRDQGEVIQDPATGGFTLADEIVMHEM
jgi:hypothetical protein